VPVHPEVAHARARIAGLTRSVRYGERPQSDLDAAKRDLAEATAEAQRADYIERMVAMAPTFTDEQRDRIAAILNAGGAG